MDSDTAERRGSASTERMGSVSTNRKASISSERKASISTDRKTSVLNGEEGICFNEKRFPDFSAQCADIGRYACVRDNDTSLGNVPAERVGQGKRRTGAHFAGPGR